jgi:hypothetical protein
MNINWPAPSLIRIPRGRHYPEDKGPIPAGSSGRFKRLSAEFAKVPQESRRGAHHILFAAFAVKGFKTAWGGACAEPA